MTAEVAASRQFEPQPEGEFLENEAPPSHLTKEEKEFWLQLTSEMPQKVACEFDRKSLERAAVLGAALRTDRFKYNMSMHREYMNILMCFGMTPASRSKVKQAPGASKNSPPNPFTKL